MLRIVALLLFWLVLSPWPQIRAQNALTGTGVVMVDVDYASGKVKAARMLQSTGSRELDEATLETYRKWTFKPRTVRHVKIPVSYNLHR